MNSIIKLLNNSNIFSHIVSLKYLPRWVILMLDITLSTLSFLIAIQIANQLDTQPSIGYIIPISVKIIILLTVQMFCFWLFSTYSGILRFSSYVDAVKLLFSVTISFIILIIINFISQKGFNIIIFNNYTLIFYATIVFLLLFLIRLIVKSTYDILNLNSTNTIPVMIYGTQSAGMAIAKMLKSNNLIKYKLVGFIDTDKNVLSKIIMGVKVYDLNEQTIKKEIVKKAKAIIISPMKFEEINPQKDLDIFIDNGLFILRVPPMEVWEEEMPSEKEIKNIQIEDLLERPQIKISTDNISKEIQDKVILITGAAGSIGSEIVRQSINFKPKLIILLDQAETPMHTLTLKLKEKHPKLNSVIFLGDVRNKERMELMMNTYKPNIIFHAAAYKHVPLMEDNPTESIQANVLGTKNMADLAVQYGVERFVMVSTDKAVNPTNVMGASKRISEIYVQSLNNHIKSKGQNTTKFITTRFGNVLGSNGSVIPLFKEQIERGGPVTVTHPDIIRYFMTIPEACLLVLEAGTTGEGGEIFIFDMGEPVKIADMARKMIRLAGYKPDIDIQIQYTGLRPGEKLYEELLNTKELTKETHHPKIMVATVREYDYENISTKIDELIKCSFTGKNFLTVSQMKKIVPEFISKNSLYESLDLTEKSNK